MAVRKKHLAWLLPIAVIVATLLAQTSIVSCGPTQETTTTTPATATPAATTTPTGTPPTGGTVTVNLVARNIAFDKDTITVPAGARVSIEFDNQDQGIPHNFALYRDSSASQTIFKGDIINGVRKITYQFTVPSDPGTYFFRCDTHPAQMTGDFVVQ